MNTVFRVRRGATRRFTVTLDGYVSGTPTLALTLPDGTSWSPAGGLSPVHAARNITSIDNDRRILTVAAPGVDGDAVARVGGDVFILLEGGIHAAKLEEANGTRAVLAQPLPGTQTPESMAWAGYTWTSDPDDPGAGTGPGNAAGTLDGVLTYSLKDAGGTTEHKRAVALEVEDRVFWTGLTVHGLHEATAGVPIEHGGNTAETEARYGDHQGLIDSTQDRLRTLVARKIRAASRLDAVVSAQRFQPPHILLVRRELCRDAAKRAELLEDTEELIAGIVDELPVDSDADGVVDGTIRGGYRTPVLSKGFSSAASTFSKGMTR